MDANKLKELMKKANQCVRVIINKDDMNRWPYLYTDSDGSLISIRRMTQDELREGAASVISESLGLDYMKASIRIDQTEDNDPDLYGYAFRAALDTTIVIVERDYMVAQITYKEKAFSASRFAEAVEQVEIPMVAVMVDTDNDLRTLGITIDEESAYPNQ